jgi:outer membrane biosynthesis protein TonB
MSCDRARSLDLAAFVVEPSSYEFASFREHYPTCAECSLEVERWTRLEARLRAAGGAPDPHPPADALLALERRPEGLPEEERDALAAHVEACAACRSELRALRRSGLPRAPTSPPALARSAPRGVRTPPPSSRRRTRVVFFAAAAALLALLSVAALLLREGALDGPAPEPAPVARTEPAPTTPAPVRSEESAPIAREPRASEAPIVEPTPVPPAPAPTVEPARRLATSEPPAHPVEPRPGPAELEDTSTQHPPVRVAMIFPDDAPSYAAPGPSDAELARLRRPSVVRAGAAPTPRIQVLAPDHVGLTTEASPTLYWTLSESTDLRVELVVTDERAETPILDQALDGARAGTHALRLASFGISLAPGVTYRWYATLVPDPEERTSEVVSGGAIRRVDPAPDLVRALEESDPGRRAHVLAGAGFFYDALDTVSRWTAEHPETPEPGRYREALLRAVGLAGATAAP